MPWPAPSHSVRGLPPALRQTTARIDAWGRRRDRTRRDPPASIPFACRLRGAPCQDSPVPGGSVTRGFHGLHILNRPVGRLPGLEAAIEVSHIGIAHVLQGVGSQGGSSAPTAVQNNAPAGIELRPVVGTGWVGPKLEHASRSMHRPRDRAVLLSLVRLAEIDEEYVPSLELFRRLVNREILDALFSFRDQIRGRLRHCFLLSHGRSP